MDSLTKDIAIQQELARIMEGYDVLLTPTQGAEMLPADGNFVEGITLEGRHFDNYMAAHMTMPFNIANRCPVMAMPTGLSSVGVPNQRPGRRPPLRRGDRLQGLCGGRGTD